MHSNSIYNVYNNEKLSGSLKLGNEFGYSDKYEIKANYTLYGKVVEKYYYFPNKIINKIN